MTPPPHFIGLGCEHCGTTFAAKLLASHPEISFAHQKETLYWSDNFHLGIDWYRSQFVGSGSITGEWSPGYFRDIRSLNRISSHGGAVKFLVMVRDPVDRMYSQWRRHRSEGAYTDSFEVAVQNRTELRLPSLYGKHLERWLNVFDRSRFLFISQEQMAANTHSTMGAITDFLGVQALDASVCNTAPRVNLAKDNDRQFIMDGAAILRDKLQAIGLSRTLALAKRLGVRTALRRLARGQGSARHRLDPQLKQRIFAELFADDVSLFGELSGFDGRHWGT